MRLSHGYLRFRFVVLSSLVLAACGRQVEASDVEGASARTNNNSNAQVDLDNKDSDKSKLSDLTTNALPYCFRMSIKLKGKSRRFVDVDYDPATGLQPGSNQPAYLTFGKRETNDKRGVVGNRDSETFRAVLRGQACLQGGCDAKSKASMYELRLESSNFLIAEQGDKLLPMAAPENSAKRYLYVQSFKQIGTSHRYLANVGFATSTYADTLKLQNITMLKKDDAIILEDTDAKNFKPVELTLDAERCEAKEQPLFSYPE